jgi:hypothetical protein
MVTPRISCSPDLSVTEENHLCYALERGTHETFDANEADGTDEAYGSDEAYGPA